MFDFYFLDVLFLLLSKELYRNTMKCFHFGASIYLAPTSFLSAGVEYDFGRSIGKPKARSQINEDKTPRARDTPNMTV